MELAGLRNEAVSNGGSRWVGDIGWNEENGRNTRSKGHGKTAGSDWDVYHLMQSLA